jgi:hypothetical protein
MSETRLGDLRWILTASLVASGLLVGRVTLDRYHELSPPQAQRETMRYPEKSSSRSGDWAELPSEQPSLDVTSFDPVFRVPEMSAGDWSELSSAERTELLLSRFTRALDRLERDLDDVQALQEARTALSLLRAELWASDDGRRRHSALELELGRMTDLP